MYIIKLKEKIVFKHSNPLVFLKTVAILSNSCWKNQFSVGFNKDL
jgi:hypothetical protein